MAELLTLDQCLEILVEANLQNVIIDADSDLVIRAAKKIHNGTSPDKVSKHWKLLQVFHRIHSHLQTLKTIRFIHVRRKANMLADRLANEGVANKDRDSRQAWELLPEGKLREDCFTLATKDWDLWMNSADHRDTGDRSEDDIT